MMFHTRNSSNISDRASSITTRTLSEISEAETAHIRIDLVYAARRNLRFLRTVNDSHWLVNNTSTLVEAIRRYHELWMPLIADLTAVGPTIPLLLPPLDVEWVWFCHTLNPVSYREYCETRFSRLVGKAAIFDEENEEYALMRCQELWVRRYPNESFEAEIGSDSEDPVVLDHRHQNLYNEVKKHRLLYNKFSWPYMSEIVYLKAARQRYKGFLHVLHRITDGNDSFRFVPCLDILLMWVTHQSYPSVYAEDTKDMEADMGKAVGLGHAAKRKEVEETKRFWERVFDQPYEKAGGGIELDESACCKLPPNWEVSDLDVNTKYKSLLPRFLLEVVVYMSLGPGMKTMQEKTKNKFLCLQVIRCHRELKIENPVSSFSWDSWRKALHLYCEFGTKGVKIELCKRGSGCLKTSNVEDTVTFLWNDLLRAHSLTLEREFNKQVRIVVSITPPAQAPYLFKCVPDKVTDDSGAMISDVILRMNNYRPQEGRWLSRTVLDHAGRECFVVRIRIGGGFWRRGGETPSAVKWGDRIIEIREGSWSYVAGSIGKAPEKVVGTATPKDPPEHCQAAWSFSTGEELLVNCESSTHNLRFFLTNQTTHESQIKLLKGRKMQYRTTKAGIDQKKEQIDQSDKESKDGSDDPEDRDGFVTVVRFTEDNPTGKATALLNWKLLIVEAQPEEDAVLMLLICLSILRSVSEIQKQDIGSLLTRRRVKEAKLGARDWGSVMLHPSSYSSTVSSPYLQPWHWNAKAMIATDGVNMVTKPPVVNYLQAEGGDKLYKQGIIT